MKIRINRILEKTVCEGPGKRFCIWVQGCNLHCSGCANQELWESNAGREYETSEILERIKKRSHEIEGITFLGVEPFLQASAVAEIVGEVKKHGLSVLVFTGYHYETLSEGKDISVKKILNNTDVLIDGNFEQRELDLSRPWVGSGNQRFIFLSDRYQDFAEERNRLEIRIHRDGRIEMNGMADIDEIRTWF